MGIGRLASGLVAVKILEVDDKIPGTCLVAADETKESDEVLGEVVAVCDDWTDFQAYPLEVGEKVIFVKNSGQDVTVDGQELRILFHKEVVLVL